MAQAYGPWKPAARRVARASPSRQGLGAEGGRQQGVEGVAGEHPARPGGEDGRVGPANSRMRWRQAPQGVTGTAPSAQTRIAAIRLPPAAIMAAMAPASAQVPTG